MFDEYNNENDFERQKVLEIMKVQYCSWYRENNGNLDKINFEKKLLETFNMIKLFWIHFCTYLVIVYTKWRLRKSCFSQQIIFQRSFYKGLLLNLTHSDNLVYEGFRFHGGHGFGHNLLGHSTFLQHYFLFYLKNWQIVMIILALLHPTLLSGCFFCIMFFPF